MTHVIRTAEKRDASEISRLQAEFYSYLRTLGSNSEPRLTPEIYLRDGFGPQPAFAGLVAELDGETVGFALYQMIYDTELWRPIVFLTDIYVIDRCRGKGIGESLMRRLGEIGRERGAESITWLLYKPNHLARKFYLKHGASSIDALELMAMDI